MDTLSDETQDLISKFKIKREKITQQLKKNPNDINEGLQPQDIGLIDRPWGDEDIQAVIVTVSKSPDLLKEYSTQFNQRTPSWLHVWFEVKRHQKGDNEFLTKFQVSETEFGDKIIECENLISFSGLKGGAVYDPSNGAWKIFKDNEGTTYIESKLTRALNGWGVYDNVKVTLTRKYVERMMYQADMHDNPFENSKPYLVSFKNGTYNMQLGTIQPNSPDNYILNGHDYDLNTSGKSTPETDKLLTDMIGDAAQFFKEFIGYGFYRSYRPFQTALFLHGSGGEGKSSLLSYIVKDIFGADNYSAVAPEELTGAQNRFKPAQLYGREINAVADIDKGYLANTAILKKLTGGDPVDAEYKGMQNFTFTNYAKLIFSANDLPTFNDTSNGFKERLAVINFINGDTRTVNKSFWQKHDMNKVKQERGTFVFKCLQAFMKANQKHEMSLTHQMQLARDEWIRLNDHFGQFLEEACLVDPNNEYGDSAKNVVEEYKYFCRENNYSDKTTAQTITEKLAKLNVKRVRSRRGFDNSDNIWRFIGLKLTKSYINPAFENKGVP